MYDPTWTKTYQAKGHTGRVNVTAPNPANPILDVWVGTAGGGAWNSKSGCAGPWQQLCGWKAMTDTLPSLSVGALALDACSQQRCNAVWVGTGEDSIRRDTQYGRGVFKGTWNTVTAKYDWTGPLGEAQFAKGSIARLVLDPTTPEGSAKRLYATLSSGVTSSASHATVTTQPAGATPFGLFRSDNAGATWTQKLATAQPATDLEMDPTDPTRLYVGVRKTGVYRCTAMGDSCSSINGNLPAALLPNTDWVELAIYRATGDPNPVLYALIDGGCPHPHTKKFHLDANNNWVDDTWFCKPGVFRSDNDGATWEQKAPFVPAAGIPAGDYGALRTTYSSYAHALLVHPTSPDVLWWSGIRLYQSTQAGADTSWEQFGWGYHWDIHDIVRVVNPSPPYDVRFYVATDGGFEVLAEVSPEAETWGQTGLAVTQVQSVTTSPLTDLITAGTQDNGMIVFDGSPAWEIINGGDGASTNISLDNKDIFYGTRPGVDPCRCKYDGSAKDPWCNRAWSLPGNPDQFLGGDLQQSNRNEPALFYPPMSQEAVAQPSKPHSLYYATDRLFRNQTAGNQWQGLNRPETPMVPSIPKREDIDDYNAITAFAIAPSSSGWAFVGYYGGEIVQTSNIYAYQVAWSKGTGLPSRPVTSIAVHPQTHVEAYATFSGFADHSVFCTDSAGASWYACDTSNDPNFPVRPVNAVAYQPASPYQLWAGTDDGVYYLQNGTWVRHASSLPNVAVYSLAFGDGGATLYAGTHGRGVWRLAMEPYVKKPDNALCCAFHKYTGDPAGWVPVNAADFAPGQACTMALIDSRGATCAVSPTDADGATLTTDESGFLVGTKAEAYDQRPLAWACRDGICAGGIPASACDLQQVNVACGARSKQVLVNAPEEGTNAPSTSLGLRPDFQGGVTDASFTVHVLVRQAGGPGPELCATTVAFSAGETDETILNRAASQLNADRACITAGVTAAVTGSTTPYVKEGWMPLPWRLVVAAPGQSAMQIVTGVDGTPHAHFFADAFGVPSRNTRVVPRVTFTGVGSGGTVGVWERSGVGFCGFTVTTDPGDTGEMVAAKVQNAFLDRYLGPPGGWQGPDCPSRENARDIFRNGASLEYVLGRRIIVRSTDLGVGFSIDVDR